MTVVIDGTSGVTFAAGTGALNYYEEGTFTPTIIGTTTAGTGTYTLQTGRYTRIGNRVYYDVMVAWSAHTGTGDMRITGLPFTSKGSTSSIPAAYANNTTFPNQLTGIVGAASTQLFPRTMSSNAAIADIAMDTSGEFRYSGLYETT